MELVSAVSENGFSLDELVVKTKLLFEQKGMSAFVSFVLALVEETLLVDLCSGKKSWPWSQCCATPCLKVHDRRARSFRTSVGKVDIQWRRVICRQCGHMFIPLEKMLGIEKYQSKTAELEKMVTEIVSEQSYRRSSAHLETIGEIPVPKSSLHRWVMQSDCDEIETPDETLDLLFVDGTGYKRKPDLEQGHNNRGEVKVALGVRNDGAVVPIGTWSGERWDAISKQINEHRNNPDEPFAKLLISDAEPGMAEAFANMINGEQRCHWHAIHDLDYMMWIDKAGKGERRDTQYQLRNIIGIDVPQEDIQHVSQEEKAELTKQIEDAEEQIQRLAESLYGRGYDKAATYVRRMKNNLFTYLKFWMLSGLISPRASSMIERMMREIGRRLKRMAFGWSEKGAAKMARIIIKRFTTADQWDAYWKQKLRINDNVLLTFRGIKCV